MLKFGEFIFMDNQPKQIKKFGTFGGVFTPTLLTILGVIMYLRLGWVVGNAGLLRSLVDHYYFFFNHAYALLFPCRLLPPIFVLELVVLMP